MPPFQNVGYIRVSSSGQNTDRQLDGIQLDEIFQDTVSGKDKNRPALEQCIKHCRKGDTLHVHSMDRLARNLKHLLGMVDQLTAQGTAVKFHKENLTFNGQEDPMSKLMLQVMGAVAEFERTLILDRQKEGIRKALAKGVKFGPKPAVDDEKLQQIVAMLQAGKNKAEIARELGLSRQTLYKALKANQVKVKITVEVPGEV